MNDIKKTYIFSDKSIILIKSGCAFIQKAERNNEITYDLAVGVPEWLDEHGRLSENQCKWIARNFGYHNLPIPFELAGFEQNPQSVVIDANTCSSKTAPEKIQAPSDARSSSEIMEHMTELLREIIADIQEMRSINFRYNKYRDNTYSL